MLQNKTYKKDAELRKEKNENKETVFLILLIAILALLGYLALANFGALYSLI